MADLRDVKEVYPRGASHGFIGDVLAAAGLVRRGGTTAPQAQERLARHAELSMSREKFAIEDARRACEKHGIEARSGNALQSRALSANTAGSGAEYVPPKWMTEQFASVARAVAPLARMVTRVDLPPDCLELRIPRFDTAAGVIPMEYENVLPPVTPSETDEVTAGVATFAGDTILSQQLYDRGGDFADRLILKDFAENYAEALQQQLVNGTGKNGQLLGYLNVPTAAKGAVPGARVVTYTSGSPTQTELVRSLSRVAAVVSDVRKRPPSAIFMRGGRYFWTVGSPDSEQEPLQRPGTGIIPADADSGPFGPLCGLPVYLDATIPTTFGAGANQDAIYMPRTKDTLLLEDPLGPRFTAFPASNLAGELTVVLGWHHYVSAFTNLYPSGIGTLVGTGLAYPGSEY